MKTFVFFALLIFSTFSSAAQSGEKVKTAEIQTEIFCSHCSVCESCGLHIYEHIRLLKGIRKVDIDEEKNLITVKFNSEKTTLTDIEKAIASAGYKANETDPEAQAYNDLDNCCKKKE